MTLGAVAQLLDTLTHSLESASAVVPDEASITSPENGISLLDTKNDASLILPPKPRLSHPLEAQRLSKL